MEIKEEPVDPAELEEKAQKARAIISREFTQEVEERENEVVRIQEMIQTTQRYIQLLKYVATCDYYDLKDDVKKTEEGEDVEQPNIHPCVKKFLPDQMGSSAPLKVVPKKEENEEPCFSDSYKTSFSESVEKAFPKPNVTIVRGTYRVKHQFIVGNVSKWIPPANREDEATHKWMLYVRDKGRDDEMAKIIKKVRYFLHESYQPHDIIEVTSSPFHLTRRGWGEFPVRVTIFFQHSSNKPIDLIHNLKLDHSFSGAQMLGGETLVEVDLIHDNIDELINEESSEKEVGEPQKKPLSAVELCIAVEHDYCSISDRPVMEHVKQSQQSGHVSSQLSTEGVGVSEMEFINKFNPKTDVRIVEWYENNLTKRMSNIHFFSTEACVKWLLKRWPIVTSHASIFNYKRIHPYAYPSMDAFISSPTAKQRASEWYRAWKIQNMLTTLNLAPWTTKQVMLYARMHGYVNFIGKQYSTSSHKRFKDFSTITNSIDTMSDLRQLHACPTEQEIDIEGETNEPKVSTPVKSLKQLRLHSNWVSFSEVASRQIGVRLVDEELIPGYAVNAPSVLIGHTLKLFLEDLLRKSCCNAWLRNNCRNPLSLDVEDILKSLVESPPFDILTNVGLGSKTNPT